MSQWEQEIDRECKAQKKRWNGKVITTARQWSNNADGAMAVPTYNNTQMWEAVRDYYNTREWN
jgi:hypothetical protein